jgi:transposase
MTIETRKRRNCTEDFKRDAVALVTEQGYKTTEAARSLGNGRRCKREFEEEASGARLGEEELKRLRKENRMLRMEKEILKKASAYFAKEMK